MPERELSEWEFARELVSFFGFSRASQLVGWAVLWGLTGDDRDLKGLRRRLQDNGMGRTAAYLALVDYRRFSEHVAALEGKEADVPEVVERLRQVRAAA